MTTRSIPKEADHLEDEIKHVGERIADCSTQACKTLQAHTEDFISCASASIRKNPVPAVVGALALGITVGCLLMASRNTESPHEELLSDAGDILSRSLSSLRDHLKFW